MGQFSIAIIPNTREVEKIANIKNLLRKLIGAYSTQNSQAHITVSEFLADDVYVLPALKRQLARIASRQIAFNVRFNKLENFNGGTFCVLPEEQSKKVLKSLMSCFQQLQIKDAYKSTNPHITIGRWLNNEQLAIANEAIKNITMEFCCNSIALRQWNENIKHYEVIAEFPFLNIEDGTNATQQSLF